MKKIINILLSFILIFSYNVKSFSYEKTNTKDYISKNIDIQKNNLIISGSYPIISNLKSPIFEKNLNQNIDQIIKTKITSYNQKSSKKIIISYDIIKSNDILSIIIYFKNSFTNETDISTLNINTKLNKYLLLNDILGANGINFANKVVYSKTSEMGIKYKKVTENTPFYVKDTNVYIIFGSGEITFPQKGNISFEVSPKDINNYEIVKENYYKKSEYNVKMVPLRSTLEYFGYKAQWKKDTNSITVLKDNKVISYLIIGENKYSKNNKFIRTLEFAPEVKNSITYVPISFFSEVLDFLFAVDNNESIIISSYKI